MGKNKTKKDSENFAEASGNEINEARIALEGILNDPITKNDPSKTKLFTLLLNILNSYIFIIGLLQKKNFKISNLKRMLFGSRSEKNSGRGQSNSSEGSSGAGVIVPPDQGTANSDDEGTPSLKDADPEGVNKDEGKKKRVNSRTRRKNARAEAAAMAMKTTQGP